MTAFERMRRAYDRALASPNYHLFYDGSGYFNSGYWGDNPKSIREACDALVDLLVGKIAARGGRILDVACGPGGTTKRLTRYYAPENIVGINISEAQVAAARERAPGCTFLNMDATKLDFPRDHFDAVICIEAAHHFDTREQFLREAYRVLKPGGSLVLTDVLPSAFTRPWSAYLQVPLANHLPDIASFARELERTGFTAVSVEDGTKTCLGGFQKYLSRWPRLERKRGRMSFGTSLMASALAPAIAAYLRATCKAYVIASARKPGVSDEPRAPGLS